MLGESWGAEGWEGRGEGAASPPRALPAQWVGLSRKTQEKVIVLSHGKKSRQAAAAPVALMSASGSRDICHHPAPWPIPTAGCAGLYTNLCMGCTVCMWHMETCTSPVAVLIPGADTDPVCCVTALR